MEEVKVVLLGEAGTGKTSLINGIMGLDFNENEKTSIGSVFNEKHIFIGKEKYKINIWDTAGQEKYRAISKLFIKDSKIVFLIYSIDNYESFNQLSYWVQTIKEIVDENTIICIIGNKYDLLDNEEVPEQEAREYANKIGAKFYLTSAKESPQQILRIITNLLEEMIKNKLIGDWEVVESFKLKKVYKRLEDKKIKTDKLKCLNVFN